MTFVSEVIKTSKKSNTHSKICMHGRQKHMRALTLSLLLAWSESRRVQQTALRLLLRALVCGISEQQRGVHVMDNHLLHPEETLKHNSTHWKWRGPNDAAGHKSASHIPWAVPQYVNFSVKWKKALLFFIFNFYLGSQCILAHLRVVCAISEKMEVILSLDLNVENLALI